ncbi:MAG: NAD(P)H-hydrate dehydratase [Elusimicrobia bacterium RIFOXYA2_FULL_39_19]|nr:MAG: NAD(P)H-hydrate dehydratase [Elusimicrobia bacterium RIFOXYA2_FULL_39_19]
MKITQISKNHIRKIILKRHSKSNKSNYGSILILAGSKSMTGAGVLCANACIKSGAGLVTLGIPESQYNIVSLKTFPEIMVRTFKETSAGTLDTSALPAILEFIKKRKITALVIGPGLGINNRTKSLVKTLLKTVSIPVVLDADGLNSIVGFYELLKKRTFNTIITPHPGEFSRLTGFSVKDILSNRFTTAVKFAKNNNVICILKNNTTVVTDSVKICENTTGNPGMAVGGSGDVLTGMIAALLFQVKGNTLKEKLLNTGIAGVYLHGLAGDLAAKEKTQISMLPSDIIANIHKAIRKTLQ